MPDPVFPWPTELPDCLETFNETERPALVRTDMDAGPPKVRRRFTSPMREYECTMYMRNDQYSAFRAFFDTTLAQGVQWFSFRHPYSGAVEPFRFVEPFRIQSMGALAFVVSMKWEQLPYA